MRRVETTSPDLASLSVEWLGHSTVDLRWGGVRVVTDPVLRDRVAHLVRRDGTGHMAPGSVDLVIVSHLHHDHLDLPSLRRFSRDTTIAVPWGSGQWLAQRFPRRSRPDIVEFAVGTSVTLGEVTVTAVPANHHGGRVGRRVRGAAYGVIVERRQRVVYFPGDTDLHPAMADLPACDVALLPIWGWGPTLGPGHLDPHRAAQAANVLRAAKVLPVHWGTFAPLGMGGRGSSWLGRPRQQFAHALAQHAPDTQLLDVSPGSGPWRSPSW